MIQELIDYHVKNMNANGDSFSFLHAEVSDQNLFGDELVYPIVFLSMPVKSSPRILQSGVFERSYNCLISFFYKSELSDNPAERYEALKKAQAAQQQFFLMLNNDQDNVKTLTLGEDYQLMNFLDVNLDGIVQPFNIIPRLTEGGFCFPESYYTSE